MSNEFIQAADDARRLLSGFRAIETVAAAFEKAGSVEQARAEAEAALAALLPQIEAGKAALAEARVQAKAVAAKAADVEAAASVRAAEITDAALIEANELKAAAASVLADAKTQVAELVAASDRSLAVATEARNAVEAETMALQAKLDALKAQAAALLA